MITLIRYLFLKITSKSYVKRIPLSNLALGEFGTDSIVLPQKLEKVSRLGIFSALLKVS
jgi:hypothetical protein